MRNPPSLARLLRQVGVALVLSLVPTLAGCGTLQVSVSPRGTATATVGFAELPAHLFAGLTLVGYSLPTLEMAAGNHALLRLYWDVQSDSPPPYYAIGLGLYGVDGALVWNYSDQDAAWSRGRVITEHRLQLPQGMSAADYSLEVWLFDPESGTRSPVKGPYIVGQSDRVHIATLHVTEGPSPAAPGGSPLPPLTKVPATETVATVRPAEAEAPATPVPVDGWTGTVLKYATMSQFDDYFERPDGERYGIQGASPEVEAQIESARCQLGTVIRVWGQLEVDIPDSYGRRVTAERLEVVSTPPTPVPEQGDARTQVDGWQGRVIPLCRYDRLDNYFERDDGVCFGIDAEAPSVKNGLYIAEAEGYPVRVWGILYRGVDDYRNARIVVERLEH